jgi:AAA ATPase domain
VTEQDRRTFLRRLRSNLKDMPLEPSSEFKVRLHEELDSQNDIITVLREVIGQSEDATLTLFSGFSGTGKSTELRRLRRYLEDDGAVVLLANAEDYLLLTEPVTIATMLMVVVGALSDAMNAVPDIQFSGPGFWQRISDFINRIEVRIEKVDASVEYTSPGRSVIGGLKAGLTIKGELKARSSFIEELKTFLSYNLVEFTNEAQAYVQACLTAIQRQRGAHVPVVFIFDGLERVQGDYQNWHAVIRAMHQLFTSYLERLRLPGIHCVYAVPPWLKLVPGQPPGMRILSTVHLWHRGQDRQKDARAWDLFREMVRRRLGNDGINRLFGPDALTEDGPVDQLIAACGGHLRGLLQMLIEVIARAVTLPVGPAVIERVITQAREQMLPISVSDAKILHQISLTQNLEPRSLEPEMIERLGNLINRHMIICFDNGASWYDTHPLIRAEVARLAGLPDDD